MRSCYRIPEGRKEIQREKEGMEGEKEGEGKRGRREGRRRVWMGRRERGRVGGRRGEGKCTVLQSVRATRAAQMVLNRLLDLLYFWSGALLPCVCMPTAGLNKRLFLFFCPPISQKFSQKIILTVQKLTHTCHLCV